MNIGLIEVLGGVLLAVALFVGGVHVGRTYEKLDREQAKVTELDHIVTVQKVVIREVPKIVTKTVTREIEVTKEVERVVTESQHLLAPDCVLPGDFGMLLVAAANGVDPAAGGVDEITGTYGCRETLAAVLTDLRAGWINTARLEGLQEYQKLIAAPGGRQKGPFP